jgi:hypothetical protein
MRGEAAILPERHPFALPTVTCAEVSVEASATDHANSQTCEASYKSTHGNYARNVNKLRTEQAKVVDLMTLATQSASKYCNTNRK